MGYFLKVIALLITMSATGSAQAQVRGGAPATVLVSTGAAGRWQTTGVSGSPWTFDFKVAGATLTGTVGQSSQKSSLSISDGKAEGTTISFKVLSPDGERSITFRGRINGNELSLVREINVLPGGTRGGNDLYGGAAPLQFIARRMGN